jgi:HK97 family phage major capsid protein
MIEIIAEQEVLEGKKQMTTQDEARHSRLAQEFSVLKAGVSVTEFAAARMAKLSKELGVTSLTPERAREWRSFVQGGQGVELRVDLQSTSQWGNVTGQTYDGTSGTQGGVFVPASYEKKIRRSVTQFDEIITDADLWNSENGAAATSPEIDDTSEQGSPATVQFNRAVKLDEAFQSSVTPITASRIAWAKVPTYRSGRILFSLELDNDLFESAAAILEGALQQRVALAYGKDAITTTVAALPSTVNNITSAASSLAIADFLNLYKTLNPAYRPGAMFYMNDNTRALLTALLETNSRSLIEGVDSFLGKRISINNSLPDVGAGVKNAVLFLNPAYVVSRRVIDGTRIRKFVQTSSGIEFGIAQYEMVSRLDFQASGLFASAVPPVAVLNIHS